LDAGGAERFEYGAFGWPPQGSGAVVPCLEFRQHAIPFQQAPASEYAADVCDVNRFSGLPQLRAHRRRQQRQFLRGAL
jgi:hypothetical protein